METSARTLAMALALSAIACTGTASNAECGAAGQACCVGNACNGGLVCSNATCTAPGTTFTLGGTVAGLSGSGLQLRNGSETLPVTASGPFTFTARLGTGATYAVTVATQPSNPAQTCTVAGGSGTVGSANVTSVAVSCGTPASGPPTLVQHLSSSTNVIGRGLTANAFRFTLPNPVGAGNVLILGISHGVQSGRAATISDDRGNSWPASPAVVVTDSGAALTAAIFVLPDAKPGTTTVTVTFNSDISNQIFQYTVSEFYGVATASPVSGTGASNNTNAPTLSGGTFTPAGNDPAGGNLVWSYFANAGGANAHQATHFGAGLGFTLLDADIAWPNGAPPFSHASQYTVQTAAAAITPAMSLTQNGGNDRYLGVSVALKAAPGAGTAPPAGMRMVHLAHFTNQLPDVGAWHLQTPSSGNLLVVTLQETNIIPVASVTDNLGNSYAQVEPDDTVPQFWYAQGPATTGPTLELTVNLTGGSGGGVTYLVYDVAGASASSFDGVAHKTQYDDPSGSNVTDSPVFTPASAPGLTITATSFGRGPSSGLAPGAPAGAIFDLVHYTGETDLDTMDNADFRAHVFNTDTSTQHWNIAVANGGNGTNVSSTAVHFK